MGFLHKNIVSSVELFEDLGTEKRAVGAFNFSTFETLVGIINAANNTLTPFILQVTESSIEYFGFKCLISLVKSISEECQVKFALHLDHGKSFDICKQCMDVGFSSVMIDKSGSDIRKNIGETRLVVEYAKKCGVSVEAELGKLSGEEDDIRRRAQSFTEPDDALMFVDETSINSLAVSVGTRHGPYKSKIGIPMVDIDRLKQIHKRLGHFPLVLHGASSVHQDLVLKCNRFGANINNSIGIPDENILESINNGIRKINIDTDIRLSFLSGLMESLFEKKESIDVRSHFKRGTSEVTDLVSKKMLFFQNKIPAHPTTYIRRLR